MQISECDIIICGFHVADGSAHKVVARAGDIMYFSKRSEITFGTPSTALGFFCGQYKDDTEATYREGGKEMKAALATDQPMAHYRGNAIIPIPKVPAGPLDHCVIWRPMLTCE